MDIKETLEFLKEHTERRERLLEKFKASTDKIEAIEFYDSFISGMYFCINTLEKKIAILEKDHGFNIKPR